LGILERFGDEYIWEHKYRPQKISDLVLPDRIKNAFNTPEKLVDVGNLLLTGPKGSGKTTLAGCIEAESGRECMYINMSLKTGIDIIRDKVIKFITTVSFDDGKKIVVGDEFERLSIQAQDSLKALIEEFSSNVNFIFISNHEMRIIPELKSRLTEIPFIFNKKESSELQKTYWKRTCSILTTEKIDFEKVAVADLIKSTFPDMRKILNKAQYICRTNNSLNNETIVDTFTSDLDEIFKSVKEKDFTGIRQYVMNQNIDLTVFYSIIYNNLDKYIDKEYIEDATLILAEYQYKSNFSLDKQIPLVAMLISLSKLYTSWVENEDF